jgi:hypothetical protein
MLSITVLQENCFQMDNMKRQLYYIAGMLLTDLLIISSSKCSVIQTITKIPQKHTKH